jgi:uncharacterized protein YecE (DUF72 family)
MLPPMGAIRIGISGWRYVPWRGVFYPEDLAQARELEYASRQLPTIEINGSFYSLQRPESYAAWYAATPPGFMFSVKGNRYITHILRLRDVDPALSNVLASGVFNLKEKLGPFLWQFPPNFKFDQALMEHFLSILPHDTEAARELALRHEPRMHGRTALEIDRKRTLRHAIEVRHESFKDPAFIKLLKKYKHAVVVADTASKWPYIDDVTADFMYLRLHGEEELYASGYTDEALDKWAERIRGWSQGRRQVYCYFDNDIKVHAPYDAHKLMARLGISAPRAKE